MTGKWVEIKKYEGYQLVISKISMYSLQEPNLKSSWITENWSKLISNPAKIPGIGMTSLTLLSMLVIWKEKSNVLPISVDIMADLEID